MKTKDTDWLCIRLIFFFILLVMGGNAISMAADPPPAPWVHILATDPWAAEEGRDPGSFTVIRTGPIGEPLTVQYRVGGTARNGVDYDTLTGEVTIPADVSCALVTVAPYDDLLAERNESVVVGLVQPLDVDPPPYVVCWPSVAALTLEDNDTVDNLPPSVSLINPPDGSVFMGPVDVRLTARASDEDGRVRTVEFFADGISLGIVTNRPLILDPIPLEDVNLDLDLSDVPRIYPALDADWQDLSVEPDLERMPGNRISLLWQNAPAGRHVLTAVATDNRGASTTSAPIEIEVTPSPSQPIVEIFAVDPVAAEPGADNSRLDTALFQVRRSGGDPNIPLPVFYRVGGSASNGEDYSEIPDMIVIEPGRRTANILIKPVDDKLVEGTESVALRILPPICIEIYPPPPDCYRVGRHEAARAVIHDNDSDPDNHPPAVRLVSPLDGDVFLAPADLKIVAAAQDRDGYVVSVEFFEGDHSLGVVTPDPDRLAPNFPPFILPWTGVSPGKYILTALATDNRGAQSLSRPVEIQIVEESVLPVVTIEATDPYATEGPIVIGPGDIRPLGAVEGELTSTGPIILDTASFTVRRGGRTNDPLTVFYQISGTADNGKDYLALSGEVTIVAGSHAARVEVLPIDDEEAEGTESVALTLIPTPCLPVEPPPPGCYLVGTPERAVAFIRDDDERNQRPHVEIVHPADGQIFAAGQDIEINVAARDPDGWVGLVEFFDGDMKIGEDSIVFIQPPPPGQLQRFSMVWRGAAPGGHVLTARATDHQGAVSVSEKVEIKVLEDCRLPVVNLTVIDAHASEQPSNTGVLTDPAVFRVCRGCGAEQDLLVTLAIGGTAENGVDYEFVREHVLIPAGQTCVEIEVNPIDDDLAEQIETVNVRLVRPDCQVLDPMPAGCYLVGPNDGGTAFIRDNDAPANRPPHVALVSPPDGTVFFSPTDIRVVAAAEDSDGRVHTVEFFADGVSLGVVTNHPWILDPILEEPDATLLRETDSGLVVPIDPIPIPIHPFAILWANVPPGPHVLTAVATDNDGASSTSEPVHIKVLEAPAHPIVEVIARDPIAAEGCRDANAGDDCADTATFVVRRSGSTEHPLRVFYRWSGAAENGVDYLELPNSVVLGAGESHAAVLVEPIDDLLAEGAERVVLSLVEPPCLDLDPADIATDANVTTRGCYQVGRAHTAHAVIHDNDTPGNTPPVVRLVEPGDGDIFRAPATVRLTASAFDMDGQVVQVEFFEGDNSLGVVPTPEFLPYAREDASLDPDMRLMLPLYVLEWTEVPAGRYVLTAVATDDRGETSPSEPVEIKVVSSHEPPVVNVETIDPTATEQSPFIDSIPDTAAFRITREGGDLSRPLEVFYRVGGSAENGVDYEKLPGRVIIEAGETSAKIDVIPIDDLLCEGRESVRIGLVTHPCIAIFPPPRDCYAVGPQSRARAAILDDDICPPNQPPRVAVLRPEDGDVFRAPAELLVCAEAKDADGRVVRVDFYANDQSIGGVRLNTADEPEWFCVKWEDVPAGAYELTAVATDNEGATTRSAAVRIRVLEPPVLPTVSLVARDVVASEDGATGGFIVSRDCCTAYPLHVRYSLGGTADNGEDYEMLSGVVTIPEGSRSARLEVNPIDDNLVEGTESVVAKLEPAGCASASPLPVDCYRVGYPARDVVFIRDNDSGENEPPLIAILRPSEGSGFGAPADIPILAAGLDPDGWISLVEFFANDEKIGEVSMHFIVEPPPGQVQTFDFDWNDVPEGVYTLTARATDQRGASTVSGPIRVRVVDPSRVPVVSVHAPDPIAAEGGGSANGEDGNSATFVVSRSCGFTERLSVQYALAGTAMNGVDYVLLSGVVDLPPGAESARVVVDPIEDDLPEGIETVVLELIQLPCLEGDPGTTGCYLVGRPDRAVAYIRDNDNQPPKVEMVRPYDGQIFKAPAEIDVMVETIDPDGWVGRIQFLANGDVIAEQVIDFIVPPPPGQKQAFHFTWREVPVGSYELAARVFDNEGAESESAPVGVKVGESDPPPVVIIDALDGYAREGTTNTAVFAVRRIGDHGDALTVHYSISGTARHGVDYGAIPYSVEIPAGRSSARIVIEAIEDDESEDLETVVVRLRLPVAANTLPAYVIGKPDAAAAVIVDAERDRPGCRRLPGGMFHLCLPGRDGEGYRILATTDFGEWEEICVGIVIDGAIHFVDPDADLHEKRFYVAEPAAVTLEAE